MPYPMDRQLRGRWCWAAVAFSVEKYFNPATTMSQCSIATLVLGMRCCVPPNPACNIAGSLEAALNRVNHLTAPRTGPVDYDAIEAQLVAFRPVPVRVEWPGGSAHFLVISGCRVVGGIEIVELSDPLFGPSTYPLSRFARAYRGIGRWTDTYTVG